MEHETQLDWERRIGRPVALAGFASAVFLVVNTVLVQAVVLADRPDSDRGVLLALDEHSGAYLLSGVFQALNYLGLGVVLWFLFRATLHRRTDMPSWFVWLIYLGPLLFALASVLTTLDRIDIAELFAGSGVTEGAVGERRAENLLEDRATVPAVIGGAGTLALAFSVVLVSLNAMRAGLLSRFLGIIGMIVGALYVIPLFGGPLIVQIFWLGALGAVFLNVFPGGRGPAWDSGRAEPWPSAAQQRREAMGAAGGVDQTDDLSDPAAPDEPPEPAPRKRRKKRR